MAAQPIDLETQLLEEVGEYTVDPLGFVENVYDWGEGELKDSTGPRKWQAEILSAIGNHLQSDKCYTPLRIAVASGHGIGKSALVGMIIHWGLSTCEDARVLVTASKGEQLHIKTVPEAKKWFRRGINSHWFVCRSETFKAADAAHADNWRADFETWNLDKTESFAGLHNQGKRIVIIFDEASGIPKEIWEVVQGALTDADTEIIWIAFGNPTENSGMFFECFGRYKHRWDTRQIDSRTVEGTNTAEFQQWVDDYGEDSDYVRIRVKGEFPRAGSSQFIDNDSVAAARKYKAEGYETLPKVMAVDPARFGDDQTTIGVRQGRYFRILGKYRGKDTVWTAEKTIEFMATEEPDALVVDGDGLGAGVVDHINARGFGRKLFEFHGGATANDNNAYFNRRAEVWGAMRSWLKEGAQIPDDPELATELTQVQYGFANAGQQIQLEKKEDMKKRGLGSPDCADLLAMSFGVKVAIRPKPSANSSFNWSQSSNQAWMG